MINAPFPLTREEPRHDQTDTSTSRSTIVSVMASQPSSGKRQKTLRWQRLERLNTPSPIIPLADDLDELAIEPPAAIEPPIAPVNLPELDAEIEVDAPDASSGIPESGESSELPTIADGSETPAESAAPEAAVEPEAIEPVAPIALDDPDWDSEVIEFVPSTADPVATETPSAAATSPTGEAPDEIPSESPAAAIVPDPADPVVPDASEVVGDGAIGATTDGEPDPELPLQPTSLPDPEPLFQSGTFTVGDSGQVVIDVLWDGGAYRGQAGIFSLSGLDAYELGSTDFIAEVARRVTSDSVLGYVIWDDPTEAARFSGVMNGEANFNGGVYTGLKPFEMQAGDKFGVVLVPDTTFVKVLEQPWAEGSWRPLFSMVTANPHDSFQMGQIADVTGDGNTFTFEDLRVDHGGDKDYNDFVFQVRGATGEAVLMDEVVAPNKDWRSTDAGQLLVSYAEQYVEAPIEGGVSPSPDGFAGDDGLLPAPPADLPLDFEPSASEEVVTDGELVASDESLDLIEDADFDDSPDSLDEEFLLDAESDLPSFLPTYAETRFEFPVENQPVIGIIDTGFAGNNPDLNFNNITWGKDYVSGDLDPTLAASEGSQHGTHILGVIAAQQDNGIGIDGINPDAPIYATRAIGSGAWAEALTDTVDHIKASGQPNGVVNLSFDLTQQNSDGSITTRYQFTPEEYAAIEYARQNGVVLVVAAGDDGGAMSALGRASQEFDNIVTVGAATRTNPDVSLYLGTDRAAHASYGDGLTVVADGGTFEDPISSTVDDGVGKMAGTEVATARVTGVVSQIWAANPELSYRQAIDILKQTATDLGVPGWDVQTGSGLVNLAAAISLARMTVGEGKLDPTAIAGSPTWSGDNQAIPTERTASEVDPVSSTKFGSRNNSIRWVDFSGIVGSSSGVNLRNSPRLSDRSSRNEPWNKRLDFDAWTYGEAVNDLWLGTPDERWFKVRGTNLWVPSGFINGNPPNSTPRPPASQPVTQQPTSSTGFSTVINRATGRALDSGGPNNSVYPHSSPSATNPYHQWRFDRVGDNYMVIDRATGRALDAGGANGEKAYMHGKPDRNNPWHLWQVKPVGSFYMLVSVATKRALDAGGAWNTEIYMHKTPMELNPWHLWQLNLSQATQTTAPIAQNSSDPNWNSRAYREDNPLWRAGFAPRSVNPPQYAMSNPNAKGNCTWYANGRLRELGYRSADLNQLVGNASQWGTQATNAGIPVSRTPQVGSIAQWDSNHVAVVEQVNSDGTIVISESSYSSVSPSPQDYLYRRRTISATDPTRYIHVRR